MITTEQMQRLKNVLELAGHAGSEAIEVYGADAQELMAIEEMGELLTAMSRFHRGRANGREVAEEAADVIITVLQVGCMAGAGNADLLIDMLAQKAERLRARLAQRAKVAGA